MKDSRYHVLLNKITSDPKRSKNIGHLYFYVYGSSHHNVLQTKVDMMGRSMLFCKETNLNQNQRLHPMSEKGFRTKVFFASRSNSTNAQLV